MKKFFAAMVLCFLLAGCQAGQPQTPQPFAGPGEVMIANDPGHTPEDQLTKTGMIRTTYSQEEGTNYLMNTSQQPNAPMVSASELANGPLKDCLAQSGIKADKCFEAYFHEKTEKDGPEAAFAELKVLYAMSCVHI